MSFELRVSQLKTETFKLLSRMFDIDWHTLLVPSVPILETLIRGSVVYLTLFVLLRFIPNRQVGAVGLTDLLVIVLIATAVQNALADDYKSIADGLLLVGTIFFWSYVLNWLSYQFPSFQRFIRSPALPLIKDGKMLRRNMRQELITEQELRSTLRLQGLEDIAEVKLAQMEADGRISVVPYEHHTTGKPERQLG
jgi:uncharacterized membrane protein YcaP (DUF421 family)